MRQVFGEVWQLEAINKKIDSSATTPETIILEFRDDNGTYWMGSLLVEDGLSFRTGLRQLGVWRPITCSILESLNVGETLKLFFGPHQVAWFKIHGFEDTL